MQDIIPRKQLDKIWKSIDSQEYVAIVGPRQAGKTTLLDIIHEKLLDRSDIDDDKVIKVTFQDPILLKEYEADPIRFIEQRRAVSDQRTYFLIDEYQYAQDGGSKLKLVYDSVENVKVIITGSSSLELRNIASEMVGRIFQYYLGQLTLPEIVSTKPNLIKNIYNDFSEKIKQFMLGQSSQSFTEDLKANFTDAFKRDMSRVFKDICKYGSYPAVFTSENIDLKEERLLNIYNTYVEKDIIRLLQIVKTDLFLKFVQYIGLTIGQLFNNGSVQSKLGIRYDDVRQFSDSLEQTYVVNQVKPFSSSKTKELKKSPIYYFSDLGLRNWSIRNFQNLDLRSDAGLVVENFVFNRLSDIARENNELLVNFWRKTSGAEVDFVLERLGEKRDLIPIEVKYKNFSEPEVTKSYQSFLDSYKPEQGLVLTKDFIDEMQIDNTKVLFVPVYLI